MPHSLSALALAATATPAAAQTADDLTRSIEADRDIVVTASRTDRDRDEIGQSVTVITAQEIEARQSQAVVDLLRTVPGVTFTRNGGVGSAAGLNIRGAETDQNVVLIDGVKINDPSGVGGGFNFGNLLVGNIRRIEVVRGSQSVLWGSQAIGGVVNLLTAPPTDALGVNARAEYGWRDTAQAVANVSGSFGPVAASAGAGWFRTDGISSFSEARGGLERDGYEQFGANAKLLVTLTDTLSLDLRGYHADSTVDADGFAPPSFAFGDTRETATTRETIGYAGINLSLLGGRFRNRLAFAYTRTDRDGFDPAGSPQVTFEAEGENERFEYQGILDLDDAISATFGAETERSRFAAASFGGPPDIADVRITSFYGEATVKPFAGLALTGGVRHDDHETFGSATTFAASGAYSPNDGATLIRASYGEGFRAPSLYQLFSIYGNRTLDAERSESFDAGVTQRLLGDTLELAATWFRRDTRNQIDFVFCPPAATTGICVDRPFGTYDNIRLTDAEGVELALTMRPTSAFTLMGQYSFIDATNRATGLALARRPRETFSVVADYAFAFGLDLGATLAHVGDSFDDGGNLNRLDGYVLADIRAAIALTDAIELYGRVENLFDERYETVRLYGTPGRAAYAGVRLAM
ncbi:TonB-dependent receptor plug domain-containing protein [Sphingomonas baiyangensis]|uniref:TonB-dependent receptor plug domain-containing protein n=1 Tax=Sphingomonas baiyangensis TaxID=2572576 RepID=UPI0037438194